MHRGRIGREPEQTAGSTCAVVAVSLAERERGRLGARSEEDDLERAVLDRSRLANQLVETRLDERSLTALVNVAAVCGARRFASPAEEAGAVRPHERRDDDFAGLTVRTSPTASTTPMNSGGAQFILTGRVVTAHALRR